MRAEKLRRQTERRRQELEQNAEAIRERCKTFHGFVREAWHVLLPDTPFVDGWHIRAFCDHLEAVTRGEIIRLLINVPPGTTKSFIVSVFWPAWEWTFRPWLQYLTTSYKEDYAKRDARRMRDLVESDWYQSLWGDQVELIRAGEMSFENTRRGSREAKAFASLTGGRGDRVIIDDPHSTETAESPQERDNTIRVFRESVTSRLNDARKSAIIIIMQRLHEGDVSGVAIAMQLGYVHLMLPMEFEPERRCVTYVNGRQFFVDPRTVEGELLDPVRFPRDVVERDKIPLGSYGVAGQYQQRPAPREGGMFKRHWFKFVRAAPAMRRRVRGWDLAASKAKGKNAKGKTSSASGPAFTAGVLVSEAQGDYYIENVRRERGSPAEVERMILTAAREDGVGTTVSVPQDPGQAGVAQVAAFSKLLAGFDCRFSPETGDKESRASPVSAQAEAGNVYIVMTGDPARDAWIPVFLDEACLFPSSTFKDQVDGLSRAFAVLVIHVQSTAQFGRYGQ